MKFLKTLIVALLIFSPITAYSMPLVEANSAILIDADNGIILFGQSMHARRYPASLTKLITALLLIEHVGINMNQPIEMSRNAVYSIPRGSSHVGMQTGEVITARQALYAIMLESANDVSNGIAEHIAGSVEDFAEMMTARAIELGAVNTNFTNAHGLHHDDHYTTAYDMSLIMKELISHPVFVDVISSRFTTLPATNVTDVERPWNNTHRMIQPGDFFNEYVVGGKTGFTNEAARTLSTYARQGDIGLITIVMGNQRFVDFTDTNALLNFGFNLYSPTNLLSASNFNEYIDVVEMTDGEEQVIATLPVTIERSIIKNLPRTIELNNIETIINLPDNLSLPVHAGDIVGDITIKYGDHVLATSRLLIADSFYPLGAMEAVPYENVRDARFSLPTLNAFLTASAIAFALTVLIAIISRILRTLKIRKRNILRYQRRGVARGSARLRTRYNTTSSGTSYRYRNRR